MRAFIRGQTELHDAEDFVEDYLAKHLRVTNPKYIQTVRFGNKYAASKVPKFLFGATRTRTGNFLLPRRWLIDQHWPMTFVNQTHDQECYWPEPLIDLYDYQEEAADAFFAEVNANDQAGLPTDAMIVMATSAGKTVLGMMLGWHAKERTLVVVPTKEIEAAWIEDCEKVFGLKPKQIGRIRGKNVSIKEPFTIGSIQTLMRLDPREWANEFGMLICDECHRLPGESFIKVLRASNARLRVGLTATDIRKDGLMPAVRWHLGQNVYKDITPRNSVPLLYHGCLTDITVKPTHFDNDEPVYDYTDSLGQLVSDQARNERIITLLQYILDNYDGDILVSSSRVTHIEQLAELVIKRLKVPVAVLTGKQANRSKTYQDIKDGVYKITIATQQIVAEGASNPRWWHVVSTTPFSDQKTMQQLKGRPIRKDPNDTTKTYGYFWDIVDNVQMFRNMARSRFQAVKAHMHKAAWFDVDNLGVSEKDHR